MLKTHTFNTAGACPINALEIIEHAKALALTGLSVETVISKVIGIYEYGCDYTAFQIASYALDGAHMAANQGKK